MISFGKTEVKDVRYCDSAGVVRPVVKTLYFAEEADKEVST